jgi:TRAP transporter TAXI family solute receptor
VEIFIGAGRSRQIQSLQKGEKGMKGKRTRFLLSAILASFCLSLIIATAGMGAGKPVFLGFAGGPSGGVYGKAAAAIAVVLKDKTGGSISPTVQGTSGGAENVALVSTGKADMSIGAAADLHEAYYGEGLWKGKQTTNFRIVGNTFDAVMNLVVLEKSGFKTVKDLAGKKVSMGSPNSASAGFSDRFLTELGVKVQKQFLAGGDAQVALKDGQLDAYCWGPGMPAPDVVDLTSTTAIRLLDLGTPAKEVNFFNKYKFYRPFTVPKGTYKGVDYEVPTVACGTYWIVMKDLPEDLVYQMAKIAWNNLEALKKGFGPLHVMRANESAISGIDVPLHPGAEKFWKEIGVNIPEAVRSK